MLQRETARYSYATHSNPVILAVAVVAETYVRYTGKLITHSQ